ncbi:unnamed protein product [Amoebophrya sp. A120]|nr:unnamed protein product [Amoebophrya sp. A120]|eukprot:GSA120T00003346001.1
MGLSLKAVARVHYVALFAFAAVGFFYASWMQKNLGYLFGMDLQVPLTSIALKANTLLLCSFGALFAAVAQFKEEESQKKVLQYSMAGELVALGVLAYKGYGFLPTQALQIWVAVLLVSVVFTSWSVYKEHKYVGKPTDLEKNETIRSALRWEYSQAAIWGLMFLTCPWVTQDSFLPGIPKGKGIDLYMLLRGALLIGKATLMAGAAQCDGGAQKLTAQYALLARLVDWFYFSALLAPVIAGSSASGMSKLYMYIAYEAVNSLYLTHACYPANTRKWLFRLSYFAFAYLAYLLLVFPKLAVPVFQLPELSNAYHLVGVFAALTALMFAAVCQLDHDSQTAFLGYSSLAYVTVLALAQYGFAFGYVVHVCLGLFCASSLNLYVEKYPGHQAKLLALITPKGAVVAAPPKKSARGRSKTPARKK